MDKVNKSEQEWAGLLSPEQFQICRKKGTEPAFTGKYHDCKTPGIYRCACCGTALFDAASKYDSGSGWPSFWQPIRAENISEAVDNSLFSCRTEVLCRVCDAHLGHVFEDGPKPTGLRYCINSASLVLDAKDESE